MKSHVFSQAFLLTAAVALLFTGGAVAAGERVVVYGADTSAAERQELNQFFGAGSSTGTDTVTTPEMVDALQGSGLPVAPTDTSISSTALTCLNKGDGLEVRTQNITRITAPVYANALVTAGATDGAVFIAAPQADPVTGETALVGALKAFPRCQGGKPLDAGRVSLAYKQVAWTVALAGPAGDVNRASAVIMQAVQPVITRQATDDAAVGSALDSAATAQGLAVDPSLRPGLIALLRGMGGLDFGTYANGYGLLPLSATDIRLLPASVATPGGGGITGEVFSGQVQQVGPPLIVRSNGQNQQVRPAPNPAVTRNGKLASLGDLHTGDSINVVMSPDGSAQKIAATSSGQAGWTNRLPPLLPSLLLLAVLLWLLSKSPDARRRESATVESRAPVAAQSTEL